MMRGQLKDKDGSFIYNEHELEEEPPHQPLRELGASRVDLSLLSTYKLFAIRKKEKEKPLSPRVTLLPVQQEAYKELYLQETQKSFPAQRANENAARVIPFADYAPSVESLSLENDVQKAAGSSKAQKKKWLSLLFRVSCTLAICFFLFKSFSWHTLLASLNDINYGQVLVALVVGFMGVILSAYQWKSILYAEQIHFDLAELINLYVVGIAFSHFLPTGMGGDAVKALYVGRDSGNSAGSASAVVMCRVTGFLAMLLVALPVVIISRTYLAPNLLLWFALLSLLVGGMIGAALFSVTVLPKLFKGKWTQNRIFASVMKVGKALSESIKRPRSLIVSLVYGAIFWVTAILNCYSYGTALGLPIHLYFYFLVVPLISLISFLPISINGYGLRESAFVYAFSTMHVSAASAVLLALLLDAQALLFGVAGGCVYLTMGTKKKSLANKHVV